MFLIKNPYLKLFGGIKIFFSQKGKLFDVSDELLLLLILPREKRKEYMLQQYTLH
jgi:hypothetical protein